MTSTVTIRNENSSMPLFLTYTIPFSTSKPTDAI